MTASPGNDPLRALSEQVAMDPGNTPLRVELGQRLIEAGLFSEAIPHLQAARWNPHLHNRAMELIARAFDAKGMPDLAERIRKNLDDDSDDDDPPGCGLPVNPDGPEGIPRARTEPPGDDGS